MFGKFQFISAIPYSIKMGLLALKKVAAIYGETQEQNILTLLSVHLPYINISHTNFCLLDFVSVLVLL